MRKKAIIGMILLLVSISIIGCKEKTPEEVETNISTSESVDTDAQTVETADPITAVEIEETIDTVVEDSYDAESTIPTEVLEEVEQVLVGEADLDEETLQEILKLVDLSYYNYLWQAPSETLAITKENMQRFAISYIYQYEYNELFFDTSTFILYIPDDLVSQMIDLFFDETFVVHEIDSSVVTHEDGYYLMPAMDGGNLYEPTIVSIVESSDFGYIVRYQSSDPNQGIDEANIYYEIGIEERDGRYIYTSYRMVIVEPEVEVTEETTEGN